MADVVIPVEEIPPVQPEEAISLERGELERFIRALEGLPPDAWSLPAGREGRDVHALAAQVAGRYSAQARFAELRRQTAPRVLRFYRMEGESLAETVARIQIGDRAHRSPEQIIAELRSLGPSALDHRALVFRPLQVIGRALRGNPRLPAVPLGPFTAVRDLWYERLELADATGGGFTVDDEHDKRFLELLVRAITVAGNQALDGATVDLTMTSSAGGRWRFGPGPEAQAEIELDPVAFAKLAGKQRSAAATRERSKIEGDVKTAMRLLSAIHSAR